jgi:hypothetical protein
VASTVPERAAGAVSCRLGASRGPSGGVRQAHRGPVIPACGRG